MEWIYIVFSSGLTVSASMIGWLVKRALQAGDANDKITQTLIAQNKEAVQASQEVLKNILKEARETNHRITAIESRELVRREMKMERGEDPNS